MRAKRGFTLIEVMITVAILGILASLAISRYAQYQLRSKRAEAYANMAGINVAQNGFLASYDEYAKIDLPNPPLPPGAAKRQFVRIACAPGCSRLNPAICVSFDCIGFTTQQVYYSYNSPTDFPAATPDFNIGACGDLDNDLLVSCLTYQSGNTASPVGLVSNPMIEANGCPAGGGTPSGELMGCTPTLF